MQGAEFYSYCERLFNLIGFFPKKCLLIGQPSNTTLLAHALKIHTFDIVFSCLFIVIQHNILCKKRITKEHSLRKYSTNNNWFSRKQLTIILLDQLFSSLFVSDYYTHHVTSRMYNANNYYNIQNKLISLEY